MRRRSLDATTAAGSRYLFGTRSAKSWPARLDLGTDWLRADALGARGPAWRGPGSKLLAAAEVETARRGCREMHLDTESYQALDFSRHRGYETLGELPRWPDQTTRIFLRKILRFPSTAAAVDKESHQ